MIKITAKRRKEAATVHTGGKDKFPVDSPATAKSALHLLGHAKPPLTSSQQTTVRRKAARYGVSSPSTPKKKNKL